MARMKPTVRRFLVTTSLIFSALCLGGCPAGPGDPGGADQGPVGGTDGGADQARSAPHWRWESPLPQGNSLRGLVGVAGATAAADELYAVGENATFVRRSAGASGFALDPAPSGEDRTLLAVARSGTGTQNQVLAVGFYDVAYLKTDDGWIEQATPGTSGTLTAAWGSPLPGEFYVVGTTGRIYHVRGSIWQREAQGLVTQYLAGAWGFGAGAAQEVYAVGASGRIVHRGPSGTWATEGDGATFQQLNAVAGTDSGADVYAVGERGAIVHRQAGVWTAETAPASANLTAATVVGDDVYAVGERGTVLRRAAGSWQVEAAGVTGELLSAVWGARRGADATVYAAGGQGTILVRTGGAWARLSQHAASGPLTAVATAAGEVYAVGAGGVILRRGATAQGGVLQWQAEGVGVVSETLQSVSMAPAGGEVYAVGTAGTIVHRVAGRWQIEGAILTSQDLTGVWVGADAVFAVGQGGRIARKVDGRWSLEQTATGGPITTTDLLSVWGAGQGADLVVYAAGVDGTILRRAQGTWSAEVPDIKPAGPIAGLYGRTADEVYAVGSSFVLRRSGGKWVTEVVPGRSFSLLAGCILPQSGALYLLGAQGLVLQRRASGWQQDSYDITTGALSGLAAATDQDLYAVGPGGVILHYY